MGSPSHTSPWPSLIPALTPHLQKSGLLKEGIFGALYCPLCPALFFGSKRHGRGGFFEWQSLFWSALQVFWSLGYATQGQLTTFRVWPLSGLPQGPELEKNEFPVGLWSAGRETRPFFHVLCPPCVFLVCILCFPRSTSVLRNVACDGFRAVREAYLGHLWGGRPPEQQTCPFDVVLGGFGRVLIYLPVDVLRFVSLCVYCAWQGLHCSGKMSCVLDGQLP